MDAKALNVQIRVHKSETEDGDFAGAKVQLFSAGVKLEEAPTVNLSRNGDGCPTPIDNLEGHNGHMAVMHSQEDLDAYLERIKAAIDEAAEGYDGTIIPVQPTNSHGVN
jgi:hypothetical protein